MSKLQKQQQIVDDLQSGADEERPRAGMRPLLTLWLLEGFDLSLSQAGIFFFWTGVLSACSFPVAARLSKRISLINTRTGQQILRPKGRG
ncbi:hypothetical protein B5K06_29320 [Rhizobium grahamii]|uniref:Uncharacterized protein n=1 Tax=Rhizobium grahamii TaxID=1120045 RepID=A0A370KGX7_9HYPH|nr:hypothetical protein B5K06_29320 [Rhizobium grahamii]